MGGERFDRAGIEPRLDDMFGDPVFQMVLRRDGLSVADVTSVLHVARERLWAVKPDSDPVLPDPWCCGGLPGCDGISAACH